MKARVKGWSDHQHYKNRTPPWIKLHRSLLDDFGFHSLPVASRALAPMIWLLASEEDNGVLDISPSYLSFRLRINESEIKEALTPLLSNGWLVPQDDASKALAECKQSAMPETEAEGETEKRERKRKSAPKGARATPKKNDVQRPDDIDEQVWSDFLAHRRQKKAKLTPTAWKAIRKQLDTGIGQGHDPNEMLAVAMAAGWQGFEFEWYLNRKRKQGANGSKPPVAASYGEKTYEGTPDDELPASLR